MGSISGVSASASGGSGSVSQTELQSLFEDMAQRTGSSPSTSVSDALAQMDSNGDGTVSEPERMAGEVQDVLTQ